MYAAACEYLCLKYMISLLLEWLIVLCKMLEIGADSVAGVACNYEVPSIHSF